MNIRCDNIIFVFCCRCLYVSLIVYVFSPGWGVSTRNGLSGHGEASGMGGQPPGAHLVTSPLSKSPCRTSLIRQLSFLLRAPAVARAEHSGLQATSWLEPDAGFFGARMITPRLIVC
jgi:hypothetical protein